MIFPAHERGSTKTGPHASLRRWPSSWRPLWYCSSPYTSLLCCSRASCRVGVGRRSCSMTLIASAIGVEFLFFFFFLSCTTPSRKPMLRVKKIFNFLIDFCDILQRPMPARGEERKKQHFHLGKSVRPRSRSRAQRRKRRREEEAEAVGGQVRHHVGAVDSWPFSDRREDEGRLWVTLCMRRTAFRPLIRNPFSRRQVLCAQWSQ